MCLWNVSPSNAIDKVVIRILMKPLFVKSVNGLFFLLSTLASSTEMCFFSKWLKAWGLTNLGSDLVQILSSWVSLSNLLNVSELRFYRME